VLDDSTPVNFGNAGCPAMVRENRGQWGSCGSEPELAGHLTVTAHVPAEKRGIYRLFVCPAHARLVNDPQPMSAADRSGGASKRTRARPTRRLVGGARR
jgi:hypothetical protein